MTTPSDVPSNNIYHEKEIERREIERKRTVLYNLEKDGKLPKPKKPVKKRSFIRMGYRSAKNIAVKSAVIATSLVSLSSNPFPEAASSFMNYGSAIANQLESTTEYIGNGMKNFRYSPSPSGIPINLGDLEEAMGWNFVPEEKTQKSPNLYQVILESERGRVLEEITEEMPEELEQKINPTFDLNEYQNFFGKNELTASDVNDAKILSAKLLEDSIGTIGAIAKTRADAIKNDAGLRKGLKDSVERYKIFIPTIKSIFNDYSIPEELAFLTFVESNFVFDAESDAGAKGAWQFMEETGKRNGLMIENIVLEEEDSDDSKSIRNYTLDERLNPILAAVATAKELSYLHRVFGDWCLATAAYNIGENGIQRRLVGRENWRTLMNDGKIDKKERETLKELIKGKTCENLYLAFREELESYDRSVRAWYKQGYPKTSDEELELLKVRTPRRNPNHRERITYFPEFLATIDAMKELHPEVLYKPASKGHFNIITVNQESEKYKIGQGETMWEIVRKFVPEGSETGIELLISRVAKVNGIEDAAKISIGKNIKIPYTPRNLYEFSVFRGYDPKLMEALNPHIPLYGQFPEGARVVTYNLPEQEIKDAVTKL